MKKIAIIGAGFIGSIHAAACSRSKLIELAAVCDVSEKAGMELAGNYDCPYFSDAETMLKELEVDIVDICLPTFLHKKNVLLAAEHGKHVICEKPITLSIEDMDEILEAVNKAKVKFMVAQAIRFWPEYVEVKKMYDRGDFGEIKMVYANRLAQHPSWTLWHKDPQKSGGGLFDLHLHDIDVAMFMFGDVENVYALGWQSKTGCHNHIVSSLKFKNGVRAVVEGAMDMTDNYPFTMTFRLVGEARTAEYIMKAGFNLEDIDGSSRDLFLFENGKPPVKVDIDLEIDAYQQELDYFTECAEKDEPLQIITPEQSREVLRVVLAVRESLETGRIIEL